MIVYRMAFDNSNIIFHPNKNDAIPPSKYQHSRECEICKKKHRCRRHFALEAMRNRLQFSKVKTIDSNEWTPRFANQRMYLIYCCLWYRCELRWPTPINIHFFHTASMCWDDGIHGFIPLYITCFDFIMHNMSIFWPKRIRSEPDTVYVPKARQ